MSSQRLPSACLMRFPGHTGWSEAASPSEGAGIRDQTGAILKLPPSGPAGPFIRKTCGPVLDTATCKHQLSARSRRRRGWLAFCLDPAKRLSDQGVSILASPWALAQIHPLAPSPSEDQRAIPQILPCCPLSPGRGSPAPQTSLELLQFLYPNAGLSKSCRPWKNVLIRGLSPLHLFFFMKVLKIRKSKIIEKADRKKGGR